MAWSRNPSNPLNNSGDLVFWLALQMPDGSTASRVFLDRSNGNQIVIASKGMNGPFGKLGEMARWPVLSDSGDAVVSTRTAHLLRKRN